MEKFHAWTGKVVPIRMNDVDTDMILPAQFLTSISRQGYGENLFRRLRDQDPNFSLNLEKYKGASILLSDTNFGCGSSREHAVWALQGAGIKVVIAKSFADIFSNNSGKNGLLLLVLDPNQVDDLLKRAENYALELSVDLELQLIQGPGFEYMFNIDAFQKHCFLEGLDELDYLLVEKESINKCFSSCSPSTFFSTLQIG